MARKLADYRRKRDFRATPEPRGKNSAARDGHFFVIQKHAASHLHYDFRLQFGDVLKSWAVPKGPSLDPAQKRLAMEVEDHPLDYGSFEGTIPAGNYGAGTVMLWDRGTWKPLGDEKSSYRAGKIKFMLHGEKLRGQWTLVRRSGSVPGKPQWFLIKHRDDEARPGGEFDVEVAEPRSVASGRDLDEIAADNDAEWISNRSVKRKPAVPAKKSPPARKRSKKTAIPAKITPQLATLVAAPPKGDDWLHEIKFDGYRIVAHVDGDRVLLETRNHLDWAGRMPDLVAALRRPKLNATVFDGEIVVYDEHGVSRFQLLQNVFRTGRQKKVVYQVFDLLFDDGEDLRKLPLDERKQRLAALKLPTNRGPVRYTEHIVGDGSAFFTAATKQDLEGIISKRRDRPYVGGRSDDWLKIKGQQYGEFVIGGYTDPSGGRIGFGALLVGYHDKAGKLHCAGRVGTGFTVRLLTEMLKRQLRPRAIDSSPFVDFPPRNGTPRGVHWVRPELVAQVRFANWTEDRLLRQPSFQGLREDKPAKAVTRETAKKITTETRRARRKKR
jgi:bifunctional non-homologous end joining protein LigD